MTTKPPTAAVVLRLFAARSSRGAADRVALSQLRAAREALDAYREAAHALTEALNALPDGVLPDSTFEAVCPYVRPRGGDDDVETLVEAFVHGVGQVQERVLEHGPTTDDVLEEVAGLVAFRKEAEERFAAARWLGVDQLGSVADHVVDLLGGQIDHAITVVERERLRAWPHAPAAR